MTDTAHIATVIESLEDDVYTLSLRVDGEATHFPVMPGVVERESRRVRLRALDAQSLDIDRLQGASVALHAEGVAETLRFGESEVIEVTRDGDRVAMLCRLPQSLQTRSKRRNARFTLVKGMNARVSMTLLPGQPAVQGRLCDLSACGCRVEFPLNQSAPCLPGNEIPALEILFPNGSALSLRGEIRHVTPAGRSHRVAMGVAFGELSAEQAERLVHAVNETEQELGYRTREAGQMAWPSPLYRSDRGVRSSALKRQSRQPQSSPMVKVLKDVARQLHLTLLKLQQRRPLPTAMLNLCADRMLELHGQHRQNFLYALHCLGDEPAWVQHSIGVAGRLADLLAVDEAMHGMVRDAVVGALLHDMGKAMLLGRSLPSLVGEMSETQKLELRGHVDVLNTRLREVGWRGRPATQLVIDTINERLDGSGYPRGLTAESMSPLSRVAAVVDVIDAMTRSRGDRPPQTAVEAYRCLYGAPGCFDKSWVTRYIQRHGFYPIGSLVRFSRGFLAWTMQLDESGQPSQVRVVMNIAGKYSALDDIVSKIDFHELGKPDGLVRPEAYGLTPF
ncbi:PilZ domain-containing protein [Salinicola avicenniae]|uniref:PilZ domain-containing protein n=1 Tax=Salinicola avicenniae TaxID=2916836 RepID=UPI00207438FB|nr:PilZ domain-containing protein [Salinicola sp. S1-1-8]